MWLPLPVTLEGTLAHMKAMIYDCLLPFAFALVGRSWAGESACRIIAIRLGGWVVDRGGCMLALLPFALVGRWWAGEGACLHYCHSPWSYYCHSSWWVGGGQGRVHARIIAIRLGGSVVGRGGCMLASRTWSGARGSIMSSMGPSTVGDAALSSWRSVRRGGVLPPKDSCTSPGQLLMWLPLLMWLLLVMRSGGSMGGGG